MMRKKFFATVALSILVLTALSALSAFAQEVRSCPNQETYGERRMLVADNSAQSQIEVTYFTTNDPNAFISEKAGLRRSATYANMSTSQFVAQIEKLQSAGLASIKKQESATSFLGETAELNLERDLRSGDAKMVNASYNTADPNYIYSLDRETEVGVSKRSALDGDYYRVDMVSWFVNVQGGFKRVDYDSSVLLKPGQTAIFKLAGKDELGRSGSARSYIAVTLRSVNKVSLASTGRRGRTSE
jgi:hypothetical protein